MASNEKGYTVLEGGRIVVISERGETSHVTANHNDAIAQHINMTRERGQEFKDIVIEVSTLDIYLYDRTNHSAERYEYIAVRDGGIRGLAPREYDYSTLAEKRAK